MVGQAGFELGDLAVQLGDDADRGAGGGPNAAATGAGAASCSVPQRGLDFAGAGGDIALPPTAFERGLDRRQVQVGALLGGGCAIQHPQRIAVGQVLEGLQRGRVVLAQRAAQRVGVPRACPDQALMARASTLIASASGLSPAIGRWLCRSVRTRSASSLASEASDLAPETWWRSR